MLSLHRNRNWTLMALGLTALVSRSAIAASTLPFYESFTTNYVEGEALGGTSSAAVWDVGNSSTSSGARFRSNAALSYISLVVSNGSRGLVAGTGTGKNRGATLTTQTTTTYASFLLNVQTNPVSPRAFAALTSSLGTGPNAAACILLDSFGRLQVAKNAFGPGAAAATYPLAANTTYLVVLRYKFNSGTTSDDEVALWLDPTSLGDNSNIPAPTIATSTGADVSSLVGFYYLCSSTLFNPICQFQMDEIRVGASWSSVTPVTCTPGTTFAVTGGGSACAGGGFPVGLSGSETGVDYWMVTNGVVSGQVVSGTGAAIDFGTQTVSAVYSIFASNTTSTCVGWMQGSAFVGVLVSPSIVTQPVPINVANNGSGTFSVTASGDGLTYQWQRNGTNLVDGGNISGATTPNLTISPAGAADQATAANGYDVVVSGTCSPAVTSVTTGLTLAAPADLIWQGGNPANIWDVNTSANWGGGSGVFNYGDKVTFDDSSVVVSVSLASSFLSPGSITVNAAQNYTFGGTGSLVGPGTLLKVNTGTLTISTFNTFSGGMTISNGIVSFNNGLELGTGPITLAGGTLSAANIQGISVNNAINVTADSTIVINNTSTAALILTNSLGGSSGTLTFTNATNARGPTIRLNGPGFTCNVPIMLIVGDPSSSTFGTNFFLSCNNASGDQVFNGAISGGGTLQRSASGGTTILNAINSYTNQTTVSGGTLLVNGQIGPAPVTVTSGTLGGSGSILGPVTVTNATLAPGSRAIGTLSISNSLTLQSGSTTSVEVNKTAQTNDLVQGLTDVTYAGTLSVTNLAGGLALGDAFTLFRATNPTGNFSSVTGSAGAGLAWGFNPTNGVLSVIASTVATNRTSLTVTATRTNITLSWPPDHTGWTLQAQTNNINAGLGTNWVSLPGSVTTNSLTLPINPANGCVFYRLIYP